MKHTPTRTATVLNILGLAVAIAAFMVVAMVRYYDLRYDKSYPGADRIYDLRLMKVSQLSNGTEEYSIMIPDQDLRRFTGITLQNVEGMQAKKYPFDEVEDVCVLGGYGWGSKRVASQNANAPDTVTKVQMTTPSYFDFFGVKLKEGSLEKFSDYRNAVIFSWLAKMLFPDGNAVGQRIVLRQSENVPIGLKSPGFDTLTVIAVSKDLPQNSSLAAYGVVRCYPPGMSTGDVLLKLKENVDAAELEAKIYSRYQEDFHAFWAKIDTSGDKGLIYWEKQQKYENAPEQYDKICLKSLQENHRSYTRLWNLDKEKMTTLSKELGVFGVVLLLLAFLNYQNYAVATVPLYLRKTNIRKIEGCSNVQLRWEMFGRFLLGTVIAFLIALVIVEICARTKIIPFVEISLRIADNMPVVWISAAVTVVLAVVASLYPVFYTTAAANMDSALKSQLATPQRYGWWRKLLLKMQTTPSSVVQFYATFAIVLFSLLVLVQNHRMKIADVGFETENIYVTKYRADQSQKPTPDEHTSAITYEDLAQLEKAWKSVNGVADMTWSLDPVLGFGDVVSSVTLLIGNERVGLVEKVVSPFFFPFFGIEMASGKGLEEQLSSIDQKNSSVYQKTIDGEMVHRETQKAWVVNETAVRQTSAMASASNRLGTGIGGVVRDFHNQPLIYGIDACLYTSCPSSGLEEWSAPLVYVKLEGGDIGTLSDQLLQKAESVGFERPLFGEFQSLVDLIDKEYEKEDDFAKLMVLFGAVTLFVTLTGLLGMVMLDSHYRRREMSLRRVYGASKENLLWQVVRNILIICMLCFAAAAPLAVSLFRKWQQHFAYKADIPVWVFLAVFLSITLLALAITAWQTLRTLQEDPAEVIQ
ncbi:MAG: ABC transporter permease [Bacteroidales bacterium]|nr:ABC transporter permease [Bacteroidales bacterium]